ncbi:MAG: hypothetical protein LBU74_04020 [Methanobacteriaceae archaeon]|jgi:6-phosphogluconolactonase/glucosamine-6-phosphate isomerase/deaminase|nr:hypothetical protein [Candidatus Methanorudis spinitermitis]
MLKLNNWFLMLLFICALLFISSSSAVDTKLSVKDVKCYYSDEFTVSVQLTDENNFPLSDKEVNINVNGWTFNKLYTDSNGRIDLTIAYDYEEIWYDAGTYNISANFLGFNGYNPSSANGKVTILQMPTKMIMKYNVNKKEMLFSLVDKNNNPVGSGRINLYINNKFYLYTLTDEYGGGSFNLSHLNLDEYLITADNNDMIDNYLTDNTSMKITIEKANSNQYNSNNLKNSDLQSVTNMKNTGLPITTIILSFLALFSTLFYYKKK